MTASCPTSRLVAALAAAAALTAACGVAGVAVVVVAVKRHWDNDNPINPFQEETP